MTRLVDRIFPRRMSENKMFALSWVIPFFLLVIPLGILNQTVMHLPSPAGALLGGLAESVGFVATAIYLHNRY